MTKAVKYRPKVTTPKSYGNGGYPSGTAKPCPTCYALMERAGTSWTCTNHGAPSKP